MSKKNKGRFRDTPEGIKVTPTKGGSEIFTIPSPTPNSDLCPSGHPGMAMAYMQFGTPPTQCSRCGETPRFEQPLDADEECRYPRLFQDPNGCCICGSTSFATCSCTLSDALEHGQRAHALG